MPRNQEFGPTPGRHSLAVETAAVIRDGITNGRWSHFLPGERVLCLQFQISRPTLRRALDIAAAEGLVEIRHGHRTRILPGKPAGRRAPTRRVVVLTALPAHMHSPRLAFLTGEIARSIHAAGLEFAAVSDQRTGTQRPQKTLEKLTAQYPGSVWILFGSNAPTQKWFAERRIPALLLGSCFSKGLLHSIDQDMRATCRHAAGQMLALGHERLGLFLPSGKLAGDLASIEGAREAVAMHKGRAELILIEHDRTVPGQKRAVLAMLRTKRQPSGLIICGPDAALACVPVLLASGVRIPSDLSVICRESEAYLDAFGIDLNRYRINEVSLSQKLAHRAVMLAKEAASPPSSLLVQPDYHHGSSLAPPRKNLG